MTFRYSNIPSTTHSYSHFSQTTTPFDVIQIGDETRLPFLQRYEKYFKNSICREFGTISKLTYRHSSFEHNSLKNLKLQN